MKSVCSACLLLAGIFGAIPVAQGQDGDDWHIAGNNTLRLESYSIKGNPGSGPYPYSGGQFFDEFALNGENRLSPFDVLRFQFTGVANDSDYRSRTRGFVPEHFNVTRENGDASLPYRLEVGDYFSAFSYRVLQKSLRGAQLELQPQNDLFGARHSILFSAGINPVIPGVLQFDWRRAQGSDQVAGASWLMDFGPRTRFSTSLVHDFRRADAALGTVDRTQNLLGAAGETGWDWGSQKLRIESELASLRGDHDGSVGASGALMPGSGNNRRGQGVFAQFSGMSTASPLDYRLRYERYDRDYQPAEAVIVSDHSGAEAHVGWRFAEGVSWRTRVQRFVDALQSGNDLRTHTLGTTLAGPLGAGTSGSADLFWQDMVKRDHSIDRGMLNLNTNLSRPLPDGWVGNLGLSLQNLHDRVPGTANSVSEQIQVGGSHALAIGAWRGSVSPGIRWHHATGSVLGVREWAPQFNAVLASGGHTLAASYSYQRLVPLAPGAPVAEVNALRMDYKYITGQHTLGLELSAYDRKVTVGEFNDTFRASAYWTYAFDKPQSRAPRKLQSGAGAQTEVLLATNLSLLMALSPGQELEHAMARLADAGIRGGMRQGNAVIFELPLLSDMPQRQRFVMEHSGGSIVRTALIIDFAEVNTSSQVVRDYEQVRRSLLDRFGPSESNFEDGQIGPNFIADLNMNRVFRSMQWATPSGTLRLGIPRRLDGQARIEIQHAAHFSSPRDVAWSLVAVQ